MTLVGKPQLPQNVDTNINTNVNVDIRINTNVNIIPLFCNFTFSSVIFQAKLTRLRMTDQKKWKFSKTFRKLMFLLD